MDFWSSVISWWKEKTASPLYFTYIGFYIVWNWKFFAVLFVEDSAILGMPRVEYVSQNVSFHFWPYEALNFGTGFVWNFIPPVIFTLATILVLPWVYAWAHDIYLRHYFSRREAFDKINLEYEKKRTARLESVASEKGKQKIQKKKIAKALTQEEVWEEEFNSLVGDANNLNAIRVADETIYGYGGNFTTHPGYADERTKFLEPATLSRLDNQGIVIIDNKNDKIIFSGKGKFFAKKLQEQRAFS